MCVIAKVPARERVYSSSVAEIIFMLTKLSWNTIEHTFSKNNGSAVKGDGTEEETDKRD